ncbi:hypothetical protein [Burkholderia gladioli]|uniref:hypothetical protein n=1 Tax=Burkholderia gladioli TaxID=28095 RepID=UPI0023641F69|nr:hypothetical protein [Burkholderia gladioli]MDD1791361.1 hypothetical protein [Burkholderia gladioli]
MKRIFIVLAAALALAGSTAARAGDEPRAGIYALRSLRLALDHGLVTGWFDNPSTAPAANNPDRDPTCRFLMTGRLDEHGRLDFATGFAGERGGRIVMQRDARGAWTVLAVGDLPNCDVPTIAVGDTLSLGEARDWRGFVTVASPRAPLYSAPRVQAVTRAWLVKGDVAAVLAREGDWLRIDYFSGGGELLRWIRRADLRADLRAD